jgi:hypothetical protein
MASNDPQARTKPIGKVSFWLSKYNFSALLIVGTLSTFVLGFVENLLDHWLNNSASLSDEFFLGFLFDIGLVLGYVARRGLRLRVASWVWIPGLIWTILGIRDELRFYDFRWAQGCSAAQTVIAAFFIAGQVCGRGEDLSALIFTMPALGLAGCSFGSWVASRKVRRDKAAISLVPSA